MQNHPDWYDGMESRDPQYLDYYDNKKNNDNTLHIGGYPYFLQDDNEFEDDNDVILLNIVNTILALNVAIKKNDLLNLNFSDLIVDISYD